MVCRRTLVAGTGFLGVGRRVSAQNAAPVPRVGLLLNGGPGPAADALLRNFAADLSQLGRVEGRDIRVEPRFAEGLLGRLPDLAVELVRLGFDIIVGFGGPAARAAQQATDRIPVVFSIVTDPVALGLVASVERPGRNVTGVTSLDPQQAGQQFELLKAVFPSLQRVGILSDQTIPGADAQGMAPIDRANEAAALALGLRPRVVKLGRPTAERPEPDIQAAFARMAAEGAEAVLVLELPVAFMHRVRIAQAAAAHRIPSMFPGGMRNAGGLITYGTNVTDTWRRIPAIVDRILKGANPGELPVEFVTRKELVFNLRTAGEIGVTIPPALLARADEVIR
jgi:putative ABC transport system substrate-binding protein